MTARLTFIFVKINIANEAPTMEIPSKRGSNQATLRIGKK
jgi:hypothetical protein|tara:strand:+ start:266 stop:385 length:120 start_codon:yes stop_codon:yes gene_type:complete